MARTLTPAEGHRETLMPYNEKFTDHFDNPRNIGSLDKESPQVGTGVVGSPACGDIMKFQIRIGDDGRIVEAKFKTFGCGAAIASSSLATEYLVGRTLDEAMERQFGVSFGHPDGREAIAKLAAIALVGEDHNYVTGQPSVGWNQAKYTAALNLVKNNVQGWAASYT